MGRFPFITNRLKESTMNTIATPVPAKPRATGLLAKAYCNKGLPLTVLQSARGYYLGTADDEGPCSRESVQYWPSQAKAEQAMATGMWTQRTEP